jgi:hypothetical protein
VCERECVKRSGRQEMNNSNNTRRKKRNPNPNPNPKGYFPNPNLKGLPSLPLRYVPYLLLSSTNVVVVVSSPTTPLTLTLKVMSKFKIARARLIGPYV